MKYYVGLDLGQARDYTAVAILERSQKECTWGVRHLHRFPLGTPYPSLVESTRDLVRRPPLLGNVQLVIDATGVGRPVLDIFRRGNMGHRVVGVSIHGGDAVSQDPSISGYRVPKRDLVSNLQLLFQQRRLRIPTNLRESDILIQELRSFRVQISDAGHDSYGAWRSGEHDDMVLAVALAAWMAQRHRPLSAHASTERVDTLEELMKRTDPADSHDSQASVDQFAIGVDSAGRSPFGSSRTVVRFGR